MHFGEFFRCDLDLWFKDVLKWHEEGLIEGVEVLNALHWLEVNDIIECLLALESTV